MSCSLHAKCRIARMNKQTGTTGQLLERNGATATKNQFTRRLDMKNQTVTPVGPSPSDNQSTAALRRATQAELKLARTEIHGDDDMAIDDDAMVSEIEGSSNVWVHAWVYVCMPKPWAVVENPGQEDEAVVDEFLAFEQAVLCADAFDGKADVMKRLESGVLTTEF